MVGKKRCREESSAGLVQSKLGTESFCPKRARRDESSTASLNRNEVSQQSISFDTLFAKCQILAISQAEDCKLFVD